MVVLLGTRNGVWLADDHALEDPERVCDAGKVYDIARTANGWLAAAGSGLYRADAAATNWERLTVPETPVTAATDTPDGDRLLAGTRPARLFASDDGGGTFEAVESFDSLPSREHWWNPDVTPHVRALATPPDAPERVLAGVDGGGIHVSDDGGKTWQERCTAVSAFVHDLEPLGPSEWVAATDAGLFRTQDGGQWWDYLYGDEMFHRYFRGAFADGAVVYSGGARSHPPVWDSERGADAALYRVDLSSRDPDLTRESYPAEPRAVVLSGAVVDGTPVAGTNRGRLLRRVAGTWTVAGVVPGEPQVRAVVRA